MELLKIAEAAEILRISVPTLQRLKQARKIPFIKVGGGIRFSKDDLVSYVEKQRVVAIG